MPRMLIPLLCLAIVSQPALGDDRSVQNDEWLKATLYGSDNDAAALSKAGVFKEGEKRKIYIHSQFKFLCDLELDTRGQPSILSNCESKEPPRPLCTKPDSSCARANNCLKEVPEKNPACLVRWYVKEPQITMSCFQTKSEDICTGKYSLCTSRGFCDAAEMKVAKRRTTDRTRPQSLARAEEHFSWEGVYEYSESGETVTGVKFVNAGRTISVKRLSDGTYTAEVTDFGRMTFGDIIVCDVRISNSNRKMALFYKGIRRDGTNSLEKKTGEFMSLTRVPVKGKERFIPEGNFHPEALDPYFEKKP